MGVGQVSSQLLIQVVRGHHASSGFTLTYRDPKGINRSADRLEDAEDLSPPVRRPLPVVYERRGLPTNRLLVASFVVLNTLALARRGTDANTRLSLGPPGKCL
jgi:hypothetical protein